MAALIRGVVVCCGLGAVLAALMALIGWLGAVPALRSLAVGQAAMKPNTVVALLALGAALLPAPYGDGRRWLRRSALAGAGLAALLGAITLSEYMTGIDVGIDQALTVIGSPSTAADQAAPVGASPGRMAPHTALALTLAGAARLSLATRRLVTAGQAMALLVALIGMVRLCGQLYQVPELERFADYTGMAVHTALALMLLGLGTFLLRPDAGMAALVCGVGSTALLGRWLLGATLVVPPTLGWLQLRGSSAGWYDARLGVALLVMANVSAFLVIGLAVLAGAARIERERAHAQRSVRELRWWRVLMDHTPAAIYLKDLSGRYLAVNATFARIFGLRPEQVRGLTAHDLLPGPTADQLRANDRRAQDAGQAIQVDAQVGLPDGVHDYLSVLVPLLDHAGRVEGVCGIATDVTDRAHAQREHDRLQQRFADLLESAPDAMVIVDGHGIIQLVNAQTEALFEYGRAELIGAPVEMLIPEESRQAHRTHRAAYTADPKVRAMGAGHRLAGRRQDASTFPVEISLAPLHVEDGMLICAVIRDVSERDRQERQRAELAAIVQTSQDAVLALTPAGVITFANPAGARLYRYALPDLLGWHLTRLIAPGHTEDLHAALTRLRQGHPASVETLAACSDGERVDIELTLWPVHDSDGHLVSITAAARDITARKRADRELRRLYEQHRHVASTLRRSLMTLPPDLPDLSCARRYLPAIEGAGIGGDWFDLIALADGRIGILIADVMGRGVEAAAVMGHLRPAAHALAKTGMPPGDLLHALDDLVCDLPDQLVTCCYLTLEPDTREMCVGLAGHLPPLLARPGASVSRLPLAVGLPLGVCDSEPYTDTRLHLPDDATLALYTDGLIETPDTDLDTRLQLLQTELQAALAATGNLEAAADYVLARLLPDPANPADDVTLLLLQPPAAERAIAASR
ncbi:PAS domain S-box protein [Nonomuraea sp. NPDC049152]|uniref:SpoIIE family protein phosphatase n=1 Tax=Nonomuraea sp. NPDC049152 TaxID=3154350 RepID=UPI0033DE43B4